MKTLPDPVRVISVVARRDRGRLLASLIARYRNFDLAEDFLQDALASAHLDWPKNGVPQNPQGWLLTVASRKALDKLRKQATDQRHLDSLTPLAAEFADELPEIPDDRLRLIFTCCHPALDSKTRIALTLRTLGGLTTPEIAHAFLDSETTMGQRLSRAKHKIAKAGIPYEVPGVEEWHGRLTSVLRVIYLIYNEGYFASQGDMPIRLDLCEEAIYLARMLDSLRPGEAEILGLLALMLSGHARRRARMKGAGIVPLEAQDKVLWDTTLLREATTLLDQAMAIGHPGPYQIQAAVALLHCQPDPRDWQQIALLYSALLRYEDTPVIRLNRAVAIAEAGSLPLALDELAALASVLDSYQPFHAANADLLAKAGDFKNASAAYDRAIQMAPTSVSANFLIAKRNATNGL